MKMNMDFQFSWGLEGNTYFGICWRSSEHCEILPLGLAAVPVSVGYAG